METVWLHDWAKGGREQMLNDFNIRPEKIKNYDILFGSYTYENYSGSAYVLAWDRENETLVEVSGAHCSCSGLEGQWLPEATTAAVLRSVYGKNNRSDCWEISEYKKELLEVLDKFEASRLPA